MKSMLKFSSLCLGLVLVTAGVGAGTAEITISEPAAASPGAANPTVEEILNRNIKAIGGQAAILKITTRVLRGTLQVTGMTRPIAWQLQAKAPNKRLTVLTILPNNRVLDGFDGHIGWTKTGQGPVEEKTGEELALLKRECEFYHDLKLKSMYAQLTLRGRERVGERDTFVIEAKPESGSPELFYFDVGSGLLARHDSRYQNARGQVSVHRLFRDYRRVDGVTVPFGTTVEISSPNAPDSVLNVQCTEIKNNVPIDDAGFAKPS